MITHTKTNIDRETFTVTFRRNFPVSPEEVFDAWTVPAQLTCWWDPTGMPLADCAVDLRPGGAFRFTTASARSHPFAGVYRVVERPTRLVFDALGAVGTVRFDGGADGTRMTVSIRCTSAEHLEQFLELGVDAGTEKTLDNLGAYIGKQRQAG